MYYHKSCLLTKCSKIIMHLIQPRRVAAISVAKRVADERGVELGQLVSKSLRTKDNWIISLL